MKDKARANQFRHESLQDKRAIVQYLNALAEGVEKGALQFSDEQGEIMLEPNGMIRFGVAAERKSDRYGLTVKLSWKQKGGKARDAGPLLINGTSDRAESSGRRQG